MVGSFASILAGIGIGLATSVAAWLLTLVFLAPRVRIGELDRGEADAPWPAYQFRVASRRRRRHLIDVEIHCSLHIPHHRGQANVLGLHASSTSFPFVPAGWERAITVSMDTASLTAEFGQQQLARRLGELESATQPADLSSLREIFGLIPGSRIDVIVFASDPLSGARRVSRASLIPPQHQ